MSFKIENTPPPPPRFAAPKDPEFFEAFEKLAPSQAITFYGDLKELRARESSARAYGKRRGWKVIARITKLDNGEVKLSIWKAE